MKVAVVTGASGGIGLAVTKKFIDEGYFVVAQYNNNLFPLQKLADGLIGSEREGYIFPVKADLNCQDEVEKFIQTLDNSFKSVDVIVHSAGVDLYKLFSETTVAEWDYVFNVNVKSSFIITKGLLPKMIEKKSGKILFVSSIWGNSGASMESVYSASKGAIISLTKSLAKELAPSNINVNCICPGVIDTPMNDCFSKEEKTELILRTPMGRFGKPDEIAELIYFLCSEKASFITGQNITSDGGFTL
jgi:3-oxoacyl-[acyl-carrier protein] reductase